MLEVIEFSLDNTYIRDRHGGLRRQVKGIPMGDPNSPGMCIGACAWMENEWMQSLTKDTKERFSSIRYMDDVMTLTARSPNFDYPTQALLRACSLVAVNTRNATWFKVRGTFSKYAYQYAPP